MANWEWPQYLMALAFVISFLCLFFINRKLEDKIAAAIVHFSVFGILICGGFFA